MTGYTENQRRVMGVRRGQLYHQRVLQVLRDRFMGRVVPVATMPTREEVKA